MVLVTGGAGLLGQELIRQLLAEGKTVRAIFNKTKLPDFLNDNFMQEQADILDVVALENAMKAVSEVYHCAGLVSFSPKDTQRLYKINVEGTGNVVNAALSAGVRKIVHVSSVAALGRIREGETINESMQWTPATSNSKYGHSKFLGEMELWRGVAEGLDAVVVNPVIILGPANWNEGSTKIFRSVYDEFPYYTEGITGFVDVRDVAAAMRQLMGSEISGERFIISAENVTYHSVFDMIAKAFGKRLPYKKVTPLMAKAFWRIQAIKSFFTGTSPLVTKETTATALAKVYFDNSKLLKALPGFSYHALQDTIDFTCRALQQKINK
ncbi:NAD-dependent epimerase/dehydratase family protein [Ferruginibacter sp. HRS2-29]|uniref:NAD-dependent epimerase/dehydratase family protein n=1 Tax=Ferruginibacter sp. HRS2-29 TaxID=2487334 RepID=UPI0020CEF3F7|nr:NAD-dependent epimerase/dehydratase family protein [Ferruginibacter sp. HRS2-29]MCP9750430.1 NAD-dependent epimerase/dehydratase family protein [Ferruginibacter sp. HRS2-29]